MVTELDVNTERIAWHTPREVVKNSIVRDRAGEWGDCNIMVTKVDGIGDGVLCRAGSVWAARGKVTEW